MSGLATLVDRAAGALARRTPRRDFLARGTMAATALAVAPKRYLLEPIAAYDAACGTDPGCGSGWTAMCCTVNGGVNGCPPGSVAAGWWKADGSGFCGGGARYYVDCNAVCTCGSAPGRPFCPGCWSCGCRCASGTCDQRRVCCNVFRYGQCHTEVPTVGPVVCRVITCIPPWQLDPSCTTRSATDNATAGHDAPCLVDGITPVDRHWLDLGAQNGFLGYPVDAERPLLDGVGRFRRFGGGTIYWSSAVGAHEVHGPILDKWASLTWERGPLGYPVADEEPFAAAGRVGRFERGAIYLLAGRTFALWGPVWQRWLELGAEAGPLGLPASDMHAVPNGERADFAGGALVFDAGTGRVSAVGRGGGWQLGQ